MRKALLFFMLMLQSAWPGFSQDKPKIPQPYHKNVIRINPTPMLFTSNLRNITLCYERLVKPNQSFMIQAGYLEFLPLFPDTVPGLLSFDRQSSFGLNIAFDYRFYLLHRNEYPAPDGLYLGPYISYYGYQFKDKVTVNNSEPLRTGDLTMGFNYVNLGFVLGYQFVFWKRFAVDLVIFGPSLTFNVRRTLMDGNLYDEDKEEIIQELRDKIKEKYPMFTPFVNIDGNRQSAEFKMFFRYSISLGYHF